MARVLVTRQLPDGGLDPLTSAGHAIVQRNDDTPFTSSELVAALADADALVCVLTDILDAPTIAAAAHLKVIANVAVGYNNIDLDAARAAGITVCNTPGVLDDTTADLAFLLILAASRLAHDAESDLRADRWPGWAMNQYLGHDVHGATLGLVGFGRIGQAVARRATGFGMNVIHHTRADTGFTGWTPELHPLLHESDVVSVHVPLNPGTTHLIGPAEFGAMKSSAVFVNTSRGPVVDEAALAQALTDDTIFAAGLDVFEREPAVHPALLAAPRTVLLPHVGSATVATRTRMTRLAAQGCADVLAGRVPPNSLA